MRVLWLIELRASSARGPDREVVEGLGIARFVAVIETLGTTLGGVRLELRVASGTVAEVRFPGERLSATA